MAEPSTSLQPTQLRPGIGFSVFGVPVHVASSFWIIAILFGTQDIAKPGNTGRAIGQALIWTVIVFLSILLHELGHAAAARAFGAKPTITLHAMGGLTHFEAGRMSRPQRWLVSFAGPAMGLLLGTAVYVGAGLRPLGTEARSVVGSILWVNIGWSLINLLPVLPFDGGQMLAALLGPRRALTTALVSAVVGVVAAIAGFIYLDSPWIAFLFGTAAASAIRQVRWLWLCQADFKAGIDDQLAGARASIAAGDADDVLRRTEDVLARARTSAARNAALLCQAWAHAAQGRKVLAREIIEKLERDIPADAYLVAAVEDALGSPERARAWLEAERRQGVLHRDSIKLLIDLYARGGDLPRAVEIATEAFEVLSDEDRQAVLDAAIAGGADREAARLSARIAEAELGQSTRTTVEPFGA